MKGESRPLVSVVIPAYNSERFIAETLDSVFAQKYEPLEVIVVDDGSTDNTANVLNGMAERTRLRYIQQGNAGPSKARNTGIKVAQGEYIAFLDADDLWLPHTLETLVGYLESHRDVSLAFGDAGSFGPDGVLFESAFAKFGCPALDGEGVVQNTFERLLEGNFILTGSLLVRKECLDRLGGFNETMHYGEDYDLWVRIALFERIACIREPVMMRRVHDASLSRNESRFYDAKVSFLEKFAGQYGERIRESGVDFDRYVLKAAKTRSYVFYLRKDYRRLVASACDLGIRYLKYRCSRQGVARWNS